MMSSQSLASLRWIAVALVVALTFWAGSAQAESLIIGNGLDPASIRTLSLTQPWIQLWPGQASGIATDGTNVYYNDAISYALSSVQVNDLAGAATLINPAFGFVDALVDMAFDGSNLLAVDQFGFQVVSYDTAGNELSRLELQSLNFGVPGDANSPPCSPSPESPGCRAAPRMARGVARFGFFDLFILSFPDPLCGRMGSPNNPLPRRERP